MIAHVQTAAGLAVVDLEEEVVIELDPSRTIEAAPAPSLSLPRVLAAAAAGSTVVAVVDTKPPIVVSHDSGRTWRESGRGLPAGRAVAISPENPDVVLYAARNRLYLSRDGGRFWLGLALELPEIEAVSLLEPELAARDDDGRAADLDPLDAGRRSRPRARTASTAAGSRRPA